MGAMESSEDGLCGTCSGDRQVRSHVLHRRVSTGLGRRSLGLCYRLGGDRISDLSAFYRLGGDRTESDSFPQGSPRVYPKTLL